MMKFLCAFFISVAIFYSVDADDISQNPDDIVNVYNWNLFIGPSNNSDAIRYPKIPGANSEEIGEECVSEPTVKNAMIYWRDYKNLEIPEDAISVGKVQDPNGYSFVELYMGQAMFDVKGSGIQPVAIRSNKEYVVNTYRTLKETKNNIKILCTNVELKNLDKFLTWIPVEEAANYEAEKDFVVAGSEYVGGTSNVQDLYFGKGHYGDEHGLVVGKVVDLKGSYKLYFANNDKKEVGKIEGFEILAYKSALDRKKSI